MSFRITLEDLDDRDALAQRQNAISSQAGPGKLRTTRSKERDIDPSINPLRPNIMDTGRVLMGATTQISTEDMAKAQYQVAVEGILGMDTQGDINLDVDDQGNLTGDGIANVPNAGGASGNFSSAGDAESRGWGPAPAPKSKIVSITAGANNVTFPQGVHVQIAPLVVTLIARLEEISGEKAIQGECHGYYPRYIDGTTTWSNHAWGLAVDFNAPKHWVGEVGTFGSKGPAISRMAADLGFRWGGDYTRTKDDMHFEFMGKPGDVSGILNQDIVDNFRIEDTDLEDLPASSRYR